MTRLFDLGDGLTVSLDQREGAGQTVLVLHGGAGPRSVAGLAAVLPGDPYVLTPTHPGFDGQPRPAWFDSVPDLAVAYLDLLRTEIVPILAAVLGGTAITILVTAIVAEGFSVFAQRRHEAQAAAEAEEEVGDVRVDGCPRPACDSKR